MNIPQIMGLRLMSPFTEQKQQRRTSSFGLTMAQPLLKDTVSFGATAKMLTSRKDGVSLKAAREVYAITETMQPKIQKFLNELFGDLQVTQFKPQNPIFNTFIKNTASIIFALLNKSKIILNGLNK